MHIELENPDATNLTSIRTSHGNESLLWDVSGYGRSKFSKPHALFDELNAYWARLPEETQGRIWEIYKNLQQDIRMIADPHRLQSTLRGRIRDLYELMPFADLKKWVLLYGNIHIPTNTRQDYAENHIPERTYLKNDYQDLAVFSIALKAMVPIFGEYISHVKPVVGTNFKESRALNLLSESDLRRSPAWQRLMVYIEASVNNESLATSAILGGLGTAELPGWLMAKAVVRRLAIGEVSVDEDNSNLVSNIHHIINANLRSMDRSFDGRVSNKNVSSGDGEEDNMSFAENYKVKQQIPDGDILVLDAYTQSVEDMARHVDPTVDMEKVHMCVEMAQANPFINYTQHHITLTQWIMKSAIAPRGILHLNKPALLRTVGCAQGILWHWGFIDLAVLMLCESHGQFSSMEQSQKIPRDLQEKLLEIYPHYQRRAGQQRETKANVGIRAIDELWQGIMTNDWRALGPSLLLQEATSISGESMMMVPANLRAQLAELLIKLAP